MTEEEITIIRDITFDLAYSIVDDVLRQLRDLTPTEKIRLVISFMNSNRSRFSELVELRELMLRKSSNIQRLEVFDCFEFFVPFLWANNGETKHFLYCETRKIPMQTQLDQATDLSNSIRSNNNNNGNIESFFFSGWCDSTEVFQPVWDALLVTGVQDIELHLEIPENIKKGKSVGNNLDFSNISTNTSLKELKVHIYFDWDNLFDSIKGNQTIEKLTVNSRYGEANPDDRGKRAFIETLVENTTLIHVELTGGNFNPILQDEINIHTTLHQIWKQLIIVKHKERKAAAIAATAAISTTTTNVAATTATDDDATAKRRREQDDNVDDVENKKKIEEEKKMSKKKKEMNLWLQTFEKKPALCNELI